jgi:hypothetical protein
MPFLSWASTWFASGARSTSPDEARRTDVRLSLVQLEERRVLNAAPVVVMAGVGNHMAASVDVLVKGDQLNVFVDHNLVHSGPLAEVSTLEIDGDPDGTNLFVDFSGGNPIPKGGIDFHGVGDAAHNSLELDAHGDVSVFDNVAYAMTGAGAGSIHFSIAGGHETSTISISSVGTVHDFLAASNRAFAFNGTAGDVTLSPSPDAGSGLSQLHSTLGENFVFVNPHASLDIAASGVSPGALHLAGLGAGFSADLSVTGFDLVQVNEDTDVGTGHIAISADEIDVLASLRSSGPSAELAARQSLSIDTHGSIHVGSGGHLSLTSPHIDDAGWLGAIGGEITLDAGEHGTLLVSGTIDASDTTSGHFGGTVELLGEYVAVLDHAVVDVRGDSGGGVILVGGDLHGEGSTPTALRTYVDAGASLLADAVSDGDGGRVVVWSDEATFFYGRVSATGGTHAGGGGFVEVSGAAWLDFHGNVDVGALHGPGGNLLLDPSTIVLSTGPEANFSGFTPPLYTLAFATDPLLDTVLDVSPGGSFAGLADNSTITLQATNSITVSAAFDVAAATGKSNVSLVLDSHGTIQVLATGSIVTDAALTLQTTGPSAQNIDVNGSLQAAETLTISGKGVTSAAAATLSGNSIDIDAGGQAVALAGDLLATDAVTIHDATTVAVGNVTATTLTIGQAQDVTGDVTQSVGSSVSVGTLNLSTAARVQLDSATNQIASLGPVTTGGDLSVRSSIALAVGGAVSAVNQNVTLEAPGITTTAAINAGTGGVTLDADAAAVSLGAQVTGGAVTIHDATTVALSNVTATTLTIGQALDVTGAVTQNVGSIINVATLQLSTTAGVQLTEAANQIADVGPATVGGDLSVRTSTALAVGGSINAVDHAIMLQGVGIATTAAINAGTGSITLDSDGVAVTLGAQLTAGAISIHDAATVSLKDVTATSLTIGFLQDVTGAVTQGAGTTVNVTTLSLSTTAGVQLTNATNQIAGLGASRVGGDVNLRTSTSLAVGGNVVVVNHALSLQAIGITSTAALDAGTGAVTLDADAAAVSLGGAVTGSTVTIHDATTVALGSVTGTTLVVGQAQDVTGAVSQTVGSVLGVGSLQLSTAAGVQLTSATNQIAGLGPATVGGDLSVRSSIAMTVGGAINALNKAVALRATGITTTVAIDVGTGTVTLDGNAAAISLGAGLTASAVTIRDASTIALDTVTATTLTIGQAQDVTGAVTQNGGTAVNVTTLDLSTSAGVQLASATNQIANLGPATTGGDLNVRTSTALAVGGAISAVNHTVTLEGVGITTSATIDAGTGAVTFDADAAAVSLGAQLTGGAVTIHDATTVALSNVIATTLTIGQALDVTGAVTQGGASALNVGTLQLSTTAGVQLTNAANQILGLGPATVGGDLSVRSSTSLAVGGAVAAVNHAVTLEAVGISSTAAINAGTGAIVLDADAGAVSLGAGLTGGTVTVHDATTVVMNSVTATSLTIGQGQDVTGAVTQGAGSSINVTTVDLSTASSVQLANATNQIANVAASTVGGDLSVRSSTALAVAGTITAVNHAVTLQGLGITTTAAISAGTGAVTLDADAAAVSLGEQITGGTVTIHDASTVSLNNVTATTLIVGQAQDVSGAVTQGAGASVLASTVQLSTTAGVQLAHATNQIASLGPATVGGDLSVRTSTALAVGGAITAVNHAVTLQGLGITTTAAISAGTGTVNLDADAAAVSLGAQLTGGAVTIHDATTVALSNVTVTTLTIGQAQDVSGAVTQNAGTSVVANSVQLSTASGVQLASATNQIANLGPATVGGDLSVRTSTALAVGGSISAVNHAVTLEGVGITTSATIDAGTGTVTLDADAAAVSLGAQLTGGAVTIHDATTVALSNVIATTLTIGQALDVTGAVTQNAGTSVIANSVQLSTTAGVQFTNATNQIANLGPATTGGDLSVTSSVALAVGSTVTSGQGVTLNTTGQLSLNAGISATGAGVIVLNGVGISQAPGSTVSTGTGTIDLNAAGGAIALSGSLTTGALPTGIVTIQNASSASLGNVTAGELQVSAIAGAVTQNPGSLTVTNLSVQATGAVTLTQAGNQIANLLGASGTSIAIVDQSAINLSGDVVASGSGNVSIRAAGIVQAALTSITSGTGTIALDGGGAAISLSGAVSTGSTAAASVTIHNAAGVTLNTIQSGGGVVLGQGLDVTGNVTQTGAITAAGVDLSGVATYVLTDPGNQFAQLAGNVTGNVTVVDTTSVSIATIVNSGLTVRGNLAITAGGDMAQSAPLSVTGTTSLTATAATSDILLASQANGLAGLVTVVDNGNVRDVSLRNSSPLAVMPILPAALRNLSLIFDAAGIQTSSVALSGNLAVSVQGTVTQAPGTQLVVNGTTSVSTGAFDITLANAGNSFQGVVALTNSGAHDVTLTDSTALTLGQLNLGVGRLTLQATSVTQTVGIVQPVGGGAVSITATAGPITLDQANRLTGLVSLSTIGPFGITLADIGSPALGVVTAQAGAITVNAAGGLQLAAANIATTTGPIRVTASGGAANMGSTGVIQSATGGITLSARDDITLGRLSTAQTVQINSTSGQIADGGGAAANVTASNLRLLASTGVGNTSPLRTAVSNLAASTASGRLQIANNVGGGALAIGVVEGLVGLQSSGSQITVTNAGPLNVASPVLSVAGGGITLAATGAANDLTVTSPVRATGGSGNVNLLADRNAVFANPSGLSPLVQVTGTGKITVSAGGDYLVGPNVTLVSATGQSMSPNLSITNFVVPQITSSGETSVRALYGPAGESNLTILINWSDGTTSTATVSTLASVLFEHQYFGHPSGNPQSYQPIPITVTAVRDPNISFVGRDRVVATVFAGVPGTGFGIFFLDTTPKAPPLNTFVFRSDSAPVSQPAALVQAVVTETLTPPREVRVAEAREVILSVVLPDGEEREAVRLQVDVLSDMPQLFKKLPDGRYRLYLTDPGSEQHRMVIDVDLREGRPFDPADESEAAQDRPPLTDADTLPPPSVALPQAAPADEQIPLGNPRVPAANRQSSVDMPTIDEPAAATPAWVEPALAVGVGAVVIVGHQAQRSLEAEESAARPDLRRLRRAGRLLRRWRIEA